MELSVEQTAAQLRCPHDEAGTAFGQAMNLRNLTQIISAFAAARLQNGDNILETGCGNGGLLGYILSQADGLHYTGLEISPLMHEQAQAFNAPFIAAGQADYRLYDGGALPFVDAAFHKAVSVNTVYFWDNAPFMLAELGLPRVQTARTQTRPARRRRRGRRGRLHPRHAGLSGLRPQSRQRLCFRHLKAA